MSEHQFHRLGCGEQIEDQAALEALLPEHPGHSHHLTTYVLFLMVWLLTGSDLGAGLE